MRANDLQGWIIFHHTSLPSRFSTVPTDPKLLFCNNIEFRSKDPTSIGTHASHCTVNPSHLKSLPLIEQWSNTVSQYCDKGQRLDEQVHLHDCFFTFLINCERDTFRNRVPREDVEIRSELHPCSTVKFDKKNNEKLCLFRTRGCCQNLALL